MHFVVRCLLETCRFHCVFQLWQSTVVVAIVIAMFRIRVCTATRMVSVTWDREKVDEMRRSVVEAKVRLVLGLVEGEDIRQAGRLVTQEEVKQEVADIKMEIEKLKLVAGNVTTVDKVKEVNLKYNKVMEEMSTMRSEFKEKRDLVRHCTSLHLMTEDISYHLEDRRRKAMVVREDLARAEASKATLTKEVERLRVGQEEERRREVLASWSK